ncbi:hypothetical protein [Aquabacterium humicola]|uniref:hypothetical protein n=1 Tax=Aquabacterium humicola TaxID=3237377 RepID=UPI0025434344|nr:hypothetical protein [Rubrivivax pictus]
MANPRSVDLSTRLARPVAQSHEHRRGEPPWRRLHVFTSDPIAKRIEGRTAIATVPYEPLAVETIDGVPCLCGSVFELWMQDAAGRLLAPPQLDEPHQLLQDGYLPSETNPRFHAQMVYAVASQVHAAFRHALGREPGWSFARGHGEAARLRVFPLGTDEENAWYDPDAGELRFGYFQRKQQGWILTALSHDIVAHELTHALLDSQRPHFMSPTSPDVPGFHEGFADLVALFQHFEYPEALRNALRQSRSVVVAREPDDKASEWLCCIARQFGQADGRPALRRADRTDLVYSSKLEEHDMGEVLLSAVFDAFDNVFRRRTARLRRLATNGSGVLPQGELAGELLDALAEEAAALARQFCALVVRAIDYCPPADLQLGEFLRAMVTADAELNPGDPWSIRETLIDAFRVRDILPRYVFSLSEDSLLWLPPRISLPPLPELSFAQTRFGSAPGRPVPPGALRRQAEALARWLEQPGAFEEIGLVAQDDPRLAKHGARVTRPEISTLQTTRRVGAGEEVRFETVSVVTQQVHVAKSGKKPAFSFVGGATLLFSPQGELRFAIGKSVLGERRIERRREFITGGSALASRYWSERDGTMQLTRNWLRRLHGGEADANA